MRKLLVFNSIGTQENRLMSGFDASGIDYLAVSLNPEIQPSEKITDIFTVAGQIKHVNKPVFFSHYKIDERYELQSDFQFGMLKLLGKTLANFTYYSDLHRILQHVTYLGENNKIAFMERYAKDGTPISQTFYKEEKPAYQEFLGSTPLAISYNDEGLINGVSYNGQTISYRGFVSQTISKIIEDGDFDEMVFNHFGDPLSVAIDVDLIPSTAIFSEEAQDIPGNLVSVLEGKFNPKRVVFTGPAKRWINDPRVKASSLQVYALDVPAEITKTGQQIDQAYVSTSTDDLTNIEELVRDNSNVTFNITAPTTMSDKLNNLVKYDNVNLFPNVGFFDLEDLIKTNGIYLDINNGNEVGNIIYQAISAGAIVLSDTRASRELQSPMKPTTEVLQKIVKSRKDFEEVRNQINGDMGIGDNSDFEQIFKK
ncbi:MAG: hypothetical protein LBM27_03605 [Lactobacillaceae bacterium]|nr:hypothetical protein [Lactobacillaceae bacterium]